jgi:hypothetical protein
MNRSLKSGRLNVVDPFPAPHVVPIAVKRSEYVARDTADPSHNRYPSGIDPEAPANIATFPAKSCLSLRVLRSAYTAAPQAAVISLPVVGSVVVIVAIFL